MGTSFAPLYANLFMSSLETQLLADHHKKTKTWYRYIDDVFFIWDELDKWLTFLNNAHPTIKFTSNSSTEQINFLDTWVRIDWNNKLYTDLYTKPTISHSYLRYDSAHPPHCKNSLPHNQMLRVKRICTNKDNCVHHTKELKKHCLNKGYPKRVSKESIETCEKIPRATLLEKDKLKDKTKETLKDN